MPEDHPVDFVCGCDARYKVVQVKAEASHADRPVHCLVCKQPLPPTDGAYILKYFLVGGQGAVQQANAVQLWAQLSHRHRKHGDRDVEATPAHVRRGRCDQAMISSGLT